jgi:hypothetical protein
MTSPSDEVLINKISAIVTVHIRLVKDVERYCGFGNRNNLAFMAVLYDHGNVLIGESP